ncbi:MAG: DUF3795 domain-containing protein [Candidatus Heimdallarchaeota archaeon]|nr:DUF3795 domain-containing protein [Candidatus Heimdallarchaeota archaeon]
MEFRNDSYCGLYCGACFVVQGAKDNQQGEIIALYKNYFQLEKDDIRCQGCKSKGYVFKGCRNCQIRTCAQSKNYEFCYECSEFPCEKIERFKNSGLAHTFMAVQNLSKLKEIGIDAWLKEQEVRWKCTNCGKTFSWIAENCTECGKPVYNCVKEKSDFLKK